MEKLSDLIICFIAFSFIVSSIYILNDYKDIEEDRLHYEKRHRPLASGEITKGTGLILILMLVTTIMGLVLSLLMPVWFTRILIMYMVLNYSYSLGLKKISVLDLFMVSFGFILRVVTGYTQMFPFHNGSLS